MLQNESHLENTGLNEVKKISLRQNCSVPTYANEHYDSPKDDQ